MGLFEQGYSALNQQQKKAVDQIDGPVLVVAGPGTGKTQLLSLRVANILQKTDTDPSNILCLTFTEAAQATLQQRLVQFISEAGYKVGIHTFHSFASEVFYRYADHFNTAVVSSVADSITTHEILSSIFDTLAYNNPLAVRDRGDFVHLNSVKTRISHIKKAGLSPNQLRQILKRDKQWISEVSEQLNTLEASIKPRLNVKHLADYAIFANSLLDDQDELHGFASLASHARQSLLGALEETHSGAKPSTKPLSAWRREWIVTNQQGATFKAVRMFERLEALASIYETYQSILSQRGLRDFDDLILQVTAAIRDDEDLRLQLQEQYQYIMVDEFQDTNGSQQALVELLAENVINEGRPNLMVVGDSNQAIYGFQGAEASFLGEFTSRWRDVLTCNLVTNYRSTPEIISFYEHILPSSEPLVPGLKLVGPAPSLVQLPSTIAEKWWIANDIRKRIDAGTDPNTIAVLGSRHRMLRELMPYMLSHNIPVNYERRDNVLEQTHVRQLLTMARCLHALANGELEHADAYLPEILTYPFWRLDTETLWQFQLTQDKHDPLPWIERIKSAGGALGEIARFFISLSQQVFTESLESIFDSMIGTTSVGEYTSPFRSYYFSDNNLSQAPGTYLEMVSGLATLRQKIETYQPDVRITLQDLLAYVDLARAAGEQIVDSHPIVLDTNAVQVMTAHKSKGQEFAVVYILSATQESWVKDRGRQNTITLPKNLSIEPEPDSEDDKLRRFYVGISRAAQELILTAATHDDNGKALLPLSWLTPEETCNSYNVITTQEAAQPTREQLLLGLELDWRGLHLDMLTSQPSLRELLRSKLDTYHLSATDLGTFLNLHYGGPKTWLIDNLLGFPKQKSKDIVFGLAMHRVLERQHLRVADGKQVDIGAAKKDLMQILERERLSENDFARLVERGSRALDVFLKENQSNFTVTQRAEYPLSKNEISIDGVRMVGKIDLMDIDVEQRTIVVTDYKTGRAFDTWKPKEETHRTKLRGYRRQLILYKLMLEHSREYSGYTVTTGVLSFIEPHEDGTIVNLRVDFDPQEVAEVLKLIKAVWHAMQTLNFPEITGSSAQNTALFERLLLEANS